MSKRVIVENDDQCKELINTILASVKQTMVSLATVLNETPWFEAFHDMKVSQLGCDPLNPDRPLNLIEQLNQAFTYLACVKASQILVESHPENLPLELNLGTASGNDILSMDGELVSEVFASVDPRNNDKLRKDINKVIESSASYKYVFFYSPLKINLCFWANQYPQVQIIQLDSLC